MLAKCRYALAQWQSLGGFTTLRFFLNYCRRNGVVPALVQAYKRLFWATGSQYLLLYERWYARHELVQPSTPARAVFDAPCVLIVGALDLPQCKKYRVVQKVELLQCLGIRCSIGNYQDVPRVIDRMQLATQLLLYRVPDCEEVRGYLREARRLGIAVGYDIDDPVFDRDIYEQNPNLDFLARDEKAQLLAATEQYLAIMQQVNYVVVSTQGMEELVRRHYHGEIFQWPNVIDGETESILEQVTLPAEPEGRDTVVIAYMSGSRAHEQDFRVAADALATILARYPQTRLMLGGYLELPAQLQPFQARISRFPFLGYQGYFSQLRRADINIVPLVGNGFNACKSTIRFLEASVAGVPSVVSTVGEFERCIEHGVTGFLAADAEGWVTHLATLIESPERRRMVAGAARDYVTAQCRIATLAARLSAPLQQLLTMHPGGDS